MSTAPTKCTYCDGTYCDGTYCDGTYCDGSDPNCGFCEMGVPLDTQEDWDNSWGRIPEVAGKIARKLPPRPDITPGSVT